MKHLMVKEKHRFFSPKIVTFKASHLNWALKFVWRALPIPSRTICAAQTPTCDYSCIHLSFILCSFISNESEERKKLSQTDITEHGTLTKLSTGKDFDNRIQSHTKSASFAAAASSELTCLKSMHGLPQPFSTTIKGTEEELSLEPSEVFIIASTSRPPASAALRRMSQCCGIGQSVSSFLFAGIILGIVQVNATNNNEFCNSNTNIDYELHLSCFLTLFINIDYELHLFCFLNLFMNMPCSNWLVASDFIHVKHIYS